jgi:hypothetical protein
VSEPLLISFVWLFVGGEMNASRLAIYADDYMECTQWLFYELGLVL